MSSQLAAVKLESILPQYESTWGSARPAVTELPAAEGKYQLRAVLSLDDTTASQVVSTGVSQAIISAGPNTSLNALPAGATVSSIPLAAFNSKISVVTIKHHEYLGGANSANRGPGDSADQPPGYNADSAGATSPNSDLSLTGMLVGGGRTILSLSGLGNSSNSNSSSSNAASSNVNSGAPGGVGGSGGGSNDGGNDGRVMKSNVIKTQSSFVAHFMSMNSGNSLPQPSSNGTNNANNNNNNSSNNSNANANANANVNGNSETYVIFNYGRAMMMGEIKSDYGELVSRVGFNRSYPTCHDINYLTRSHNHIDIISGFTTGDYLILDTIGYKYNRFNKMGVINQSPVTHIKWIPGSDSLFLASHQDGSVMLFDKNRDDSPNFQPAIQPPSTDNSSPALLSNVNTNVSSSSSNKRIVPDVLPMTITRSTRSKYNPVSHWQVSRKPITAFEFSPDHRYIAMVSLDGILRVIDYENEVIIDAFQSYFGGLLCVTWSHDGRYILTGGQDDLVTIWDFNSRKIVARCEGHQSWVSSVCFDPYNCDDKNYRFASVGDDSRVLFWDFSDQTLHRPKSTLHKRRTSRVNLSVVGSHQSHSKISTFSNSELKSSSTTSLVHNVSGGGNTNLETLQKLAINGPRVHPILPIKDVATLPPVMIVQAHEAPINQIIFHEDALYTVCRKGKVKVWTRPNKQ
ncbi:WD40 repeat-like protein [Ramicandelaber brevisporus]|nr:WD40 repeat-like protein [Ramicandelaber brevisporus]